MHSMVPGERRHQDFPNLSWASALFFCISVALAIFAYSSKLLYDPAGHLLTSSCLILSGCVAVAILGIAIRTRYLRPLSWLVLALFGQAAALQWIDAGPMIHYQHYRSPAYLLEHGYLGGILFLQALLVSRGIWAHRSTIRNWIGTHLPGWRLWVAAGLIFLPAAPVSRDVRFYAMELVLASLVQAINLGNYYLALDALPEDALALWRKSTARWLGPDEHGRPRVDRFAFCAAAWVTACGIVLVLFSYENHPHIPDEVAYLTHAKYFAEGKLAMPVPPAPAAFNIDLLELDRGLWYSPVPPGWPALLAVGAWLGIPWAVNPILGGLCVLVAYPLVQHFETRRTARIVVLLLCISPWFLFLNMSFMTHAFTTLCALVACEAIARVKKGGHTGWALLAGAAIGTGSLIRPLDGLIAGVVAGVWAISGRRLRFASLALLVLSAAGMAATTLPYNRALTGEWLRAPIMAYTDHHYGAKSNALGFGPERGWGWGLDPYPGHTPLESLINDNLNAFSVNVELFGWATGSFFLLAALLLLKGSAQRLDWALVGAIGVVVFAYAFYWYSGGPDFGARYWYLALVPLVILSARGIRTLDDRAGGLASVGVLLLCLLTVVNYLPWRAVDKYHGYLQMHPDIRTLAAKHAFGRSLVLIRGDRHPDYASAVIYNPTDLYANAPVYAWDASPEARRQLLDVYADRPVWVLDGPTRTGYGFRLVAGPLSAASVLSPGKLP